MPAEPNDWRLLNQKLYLKDAVLQRKHYTRHSETWDHDHCPFCGMTFMVEDRPEVLHEGYTTLDQFYWICEECFKKFKDLFNWTIKPG